MGVGVGSGGGRVVNRGVRSVYVRRRERLFFFLPKGGTNDELTWNQDCGRFRK